MVEISQNFVAFSEYMNLKKNLVKSQVYKQIFKCDMTIVLTPLRIGWTLHVPVCEFNVKNAQKIFEKKYLGLYFLHER